MEAINELRELIRRRIAERGWSYGEVVRRGHLPRSTVHNLATTDTLLRLPQPSTLAGLARGLDLPLDVVRAAAARAAGLRVYEERGTDPEVAVLIASVEQLRPADRRHVAALVEFLLRQARNSDEER